MMLFPRFPHGPRHYFLPSFWFPRSQTLPCLKVQFYLTCHRASLCITDYLPHQIIYRFLSLPILPMGLSAPRTRARISVCSVHGPVRDRLAWASSQYWMHKLHNPSNRLMKQGPNLRRPRRSCRGLPTWPHGSHVVGPRFKSDVRLPSHDLLSRLEVPRL